MEYHVHIIGAGLAGSEAALRLASLGISVSLFEMRPVTTTPVHRSDCCAELVCSNSLKSMKPESAAGMLKEELRVLGSPVFACAMANRVPAGGALAVNREAFCESVTQAIENSPAIELIRAEAVGLCPDGDVLVRDDGGDVRPFGHPADGIVIASGPLTSDTLATCLQEWTGTQSLAFYDAAAPIVMADSLDMSKLFRQSRYENDAPGDYLNAPMDKESYEHFIEELLAAKRVIAKDFETKDLFQACQPIEEIARKGKDAPRFGTLKPVGLIDPATGRRPWAALQLRAEDAHGLSYNLVGFQTNLCFPEQKRVFRMIPGLEQAEFARYGVMHRNTFIDAPHLLDTRMRYHGPAGAKPPCDVPLYIAGQLAGTEGYCEAIRSGAHVALHLAAELRGVPAPELPEETVFGALMSYAGNPETLDYQPMHVNFGIMPPLNERIKNKGQRYARYAERGQQALRSYTAALKELGLLETVEV